MPLTVTDRDRCLGSSLLIVRVCKSGPPLVVGANATVTVAELPFDPVMDPPPCT